MAISLEWVDDEHTLLYVKVTGGSSTPYEDFMAASQQAQVMLSSVSHPVEAICDTRMQFAFSPRVLEIAFAVHKFKYPNIRFIVFVGRKMAWELFLIFVRQFGRLPYRFVGVDNLDEAHIMLQRIRRESLLEAQMSSAPLN